MKLAKADRIYGVLAGFHLVSASEDSVERTFEALRSISPKIMSPMHCSGFKFTSRIAREMGESFVQNCVGTQVLI